MRMLSNGGSFLQEFVSRGSFSQKGTITVGEFTFVSKLMYRKHLKNTVYSLLVSCSEL